MLSAILAVGLGAALGALLRWGLALGLNQLLPQLPPGTLAANLVGGYLIGLAMAFFAQAPALPPEWRLFVITGFLGGLTTFSTFSAEVVTALQQGRLGWALATVGTHVLGSLACTLAGIATLPLLRR
ncbi:Putative fluoride ion transporter CrcB [Rubrivivax sp. A210]|uniref:fluoride efflux transporter CrcB n=1 Tax=Rubrivivax sp. A210 TaxID=2772301 RepID=UPI00191AE747|nr:fluoride efflux transporter CrcB [Rubrivivax sp. A210]CAD5372840.1 Putative fluoride ion transporter CrcB [Rubrivivax sp. A210]